MKRINKLLTIALGLTLFVGSTMRINPVKAESLPINLEEKLNETKVVNDSVDPTEIKLETEVDFISVEWDINDIGDTSVDHGEGTEIPVNRIKNLPEGTDYCAIFTLKYLDAAGIEQEELIWGDDFEITNAYHQEDFELVIDYAEDPTSIKIQNHPLIDSVDWEIDLDLGDGLLVPTLSGEGQEITSTDLDKLDEGNYIATFKIFKDEGDDLSSIAAVREVEFSVTYPLTNVEPKITIDKLLNPKSIEIEEKNSMSNIEWEIIDNEASTSEAFGAGASIPTADLSTLADGQYIVEFTYDKKDSGGIEVSQSTESPVFVVSSAEAVVVLEHAIDPQYIRFEASVDAFDVEWVISSEEDGVQYETVSGEGTSIPKSVLRGLNPKYDHYAMFKYSVDMGDDTSYIADVESEMFKISANYYIPELEVVMDDDINPTDIKVKADPSIKQVDWTVYQDLDDGLSSPLHSGSGSLDSTELYDKLDLDKYYVEFTVEQWINNKTETQIVELESEQFIIVKDSQLPEIKSFVEGGNINPTKVGIEEHFLLSHDDDNWTIYDSDDKAVLTGSGFSISDLKSILAEGEYYVEFAIYQENEESLNSGLYVPMMIKTDSFNIVKAVSAGSLETTINAAKALNADDYETKEFDEMLVVLAKAEALLAKAQNQNALTRSIVTQQELDDMELDLLRAIDALVVKKDIDNPSVPKPGKPGKPGDKNPIKPEDKNPIKPGSKDPIKPENDKVSQKDELKVESNAVNTGVVQSYLPFAIILVVALGGLAIIIRNKKKENN